MPFHSDMYARSRRIHRQMDDVEKEMKECGSLMEAMFKTAKPKRKKKAVLKKKPDKEPKQPVEIKPPPTVQDQLHGIAQYFAERYGALDTMPLHPQQRALLRKKLLEEQAELIEDTLFKGKKKQSPTMSEFTPANIFGDETDDDEPALDWRDFLPKDENDD